MLALRILAILISAMSCAGWYGIYYPPGTAIPSPAAVGPPCTNPAGAPQLIHVSDGVGQNNIFSLQGEGLTAGANLDVAISPASASSPPACPPGGAVYPAILQSDANHAQWLAARFPAKSAPDAYWVWAKNATGWSAPVLMNGANALWISDNSAWAGQQIEIVGRNFDRGEFGGTSSTLARLRTAGGTAYPLTISTLEPARLTVTIGNSTVNPLGTYFVDVSNDGGLNWSTVSETDYSGAQQQLTIVGAGSDPYGIGHAWAGDSNFNYANIVTVTPTGRDETATVQALINAGTAGGVVIKFLNGTHKFAGELTVKSNVVFVGESKAGTILQWTGTNLFQNFMAMPSGDHVIFADLQMQVADTNHRPDKFLPIGYDPLDQSQRMTHHVAIVNVDISYDAATGTSTSGSSPGFGAAAWIQMRDHLVIKNCTWSGYNASILQNFTREYADISGNHFTYAGGATNSFAKFSVIQNNTLTGQTITPVNTVVSHVIQVKSDYLVTHNTISNCVNAWNSCEIVMSETGDFSNFNAGTVASATATTVTIASSVIALAAPVTYVSDLYLFIGDGTGAGQAQRVTNVTSTTITVAQPWKVIPGAGARWTLVSANQNPTITFNTASNTTGGIEPLGNSINTYIADNVLTNTPGIIFYGVSQSNGIGYGPNKPVYIPNFFARIVRNTLTGLGPASNSVAIIAACPRDAVASFGGKICYGVDIIGNSITGDHTVTSNDRNFQSYYGSGIIAASIVGTAYDPLTGGIGDVTNFVAQSNVLHDLTNGIMLTEGDDGVLLSDNSYDVNVGAFLLNSAGAYGTANNLYQSNNTLH